jgi:hypothetical protein
MNIQPGDFVRLLPRERPFRDDPHAWWKVIAIGDYSFDALYLSLSVARRGVAFGSVTGHRKADEPETAA